MARTLLNTLSPTQRQDLATRILAYLTDAVVAAHLQIDHTGAHLLTGHRAYILELEQYLQQNGGGAFVPLPKWDPATPIPAEFNTVKAQDNGTARPPLQNLNPNRPLPPAFRPPTLCNVPTEDALGNGLNGWHGGVHIAVGGSMANGVIASAAPIFWCWHAFIDDVYENWLACPSHGQQPIAVDLLDADVLLRAPKPSGAVTPQLFREWADWSKNNLRLKE